MNVNYTRRWFPEFVEARRLVRARVSLASCRRSSSRWAARGPCCSGTTPTRIDLINFLADSEPVWVWAELEPGFEDYGTAYAGDGGNDPATEPGANYYIAYANGVRAYLTGIKDTVGLDTCVTPHRPAWRVWSWTSRGSGCIRSTTRTSGPSPASRPIQRPLPRWTVAGMQARCIDLVDRDGRGSRSREPAGGGADDRGHHPGDPRVPGARQHQGPALGVRAGGSPGTPRHVNQAQEQ